MDSQIDTLKNLALLSSKANEQLNDFVTNEFLSYLITNFEFIDFESVQIDSRFLTFDIAIENMPRFWAEQSNVDILGYNAEVTAYCSNQHQFTIQIEFNDEKLPEMVDINGSFVLYPPDLLQFLAKNKRIREQYLLNDWRLFGIQRAQAHITQIEKLIESYRSRL